MTTSRGKAYRWFGAVLFAAASFDYTFAQDPPVIDFKINNGLVPTAASEFPLSGAEPAYSGAIPDPRTGSVYRVELHWPAGGGTTRAPVLWEPEAECLTPLQAPEQLGPGSWMIFSALPSGAAGASCNPQRSVGGAAGIVRVNVKISIDANVVSHVIEVVPRDAQEPAAVHTAPLRQAEVLWQTGYFDEQRLLRRTLDTLDGLYLVTNEGVFRAVDVGDGRGTTGFFVVETTDVYADFFRRGELFYRGAAARSRGVAQNWLRQLKPIEGSKSPAGV